VTPQKWENRVLREIQAISLGTFLLVQIVSIERDRHHAGHGWVWVLEEIIPYSILLIVADDFVQAIGFLNRCAEQVNFRVRSDYTVTRGYCQDVDATVIRMLLAICQIAPKLYRPGATRPLNLAEPRKQFPCTSAVAQ
jgi:hypothetical protein